MSTGYVSATDAEFHAIIEDQTARKSLAKFLKQSFSEQHIEFLEAVCSYVSQCEKAIDASKINTDYDDNDEFEYDYTILTSTPQILTTAHQIYSTYIKQSGSAAINISEIERTRIHKALESLDNQVKLSQCASPTNTSKEGRSFAFRQQVTNQQQQQQQQQQRHARLSHHGQFIDIDEPDVEVDTFDGQVQLPNKTGNDSQYETEPAIPFLHIFDNAVQTCKELIKHNFYLSFQQTAEYKAWKNNKSRQENEDNSKKKKKKKKSACCIM